MIPYLLIFTSISILAFWANAREPIPGNRFIALSWNPLWILILVFFTIFIGLRHEIGGDWVAYSAYYDDMYGMTLSEGMGLTSDPGYLLLNWLSSKGNLGMAAVNLFCGFIFSLGLVLLCRSLSRPLIALLASFPYMIVVVAMGYTRQGVALGFAMIAIVYLCREKNILFFLFIILAASFHKTAIVLLPIAALAAARNKYLMIFWVAVIGLTAYYTVLAASFDRLILYYVTNSYQSDGALVRLVMILIPSSLLLLWPHRFHFADSELRLWKIFSFISIALFCLYFLSDASTAIDRMALYMLPIQAVIFSALPEFFGTKGEVRQWIILGTIVYFLTVLMVWMNFSPYAWHWIPYSNILLESI